MNLDFIQSLIKKEDTKIVFLVIDGLGGIPTDEEDLTELEKASTPNLDKIVSDGVCGLHQPVKTGVTPGSGPGHLALFGYDPLKYQIGRGVLEGLGINFELTSKDVAARGNFCTVDEEGKVQDRRAGRISTEKNKELCKKLSDIDLPNVKVFVEPVKEHRFLLVLRGDDLSSDLRNTDPQEVGKKPFKPKILSPEAEETAELVKSFENKAAEILEDEHPANMVLLRGFSKKPDWPSMEEVYSLKSAAIAAYPMYRGLAKLIGMESLDTKQTIEGELDALEEKWKDFDFFYLHIKESDSAGEDGDYNRKVSVIEKVDKQLPRILKLNPDVLVVTGDHSTPSPLKYHSWHPVPVVVWSKNCQKDNVKTFGERECMKGGLGSRFPAKELMSLSLANAKRLEKFGA